MANIAIVTTSLTGMGHATCEVARRLSRHGHRITIVRPNIDAVAQGPWDTVEIPAVVREPEKHGHSQAHRLGLGTFMEAMVDLGPDLALVDLDMPEHVIAAVQLRLRVALLSQWFSVEQRRGLPPLSSSARPDKHSNIRLAGMWARDRHRKRTTGWKTRVLTGGTDRHSRLWAYAREAGLSRRDLRSHQWPSAFGFRQLPILVLNLQELEFPHVSRSGVFYTGPMVDPHVPFVDFDTPWGKRLREASDRRLIVCTLSTMQRTAADITFLRSLVDAVRDREDWMLVVGLGGHPRDHQLRDSANVIIEPWVPQRSLLNLAHASINHGGIGTINECLHHRVPMVVASGGQHDQNGCATRIDVANIGRSIPRSAPPGCIEASLDEALDSTSIRSSIEDMHRAYQRSISERRLEIAIDRLLT